MKLEKKENSYFVKKKKGFQASPIDPAFVKQAFDFAYEMAFGKGFHRHHRSGGEIIRTDAEIFQNTFQGKIAEIVLYELLKLQDINVEAPDFSIHGSGIWDEADLKANGKSICIKSAAFFSDLLLLGTKDWDLEGNYIPNLKKNHEAIYDYFVLVRIKPDIKKIIRETVLDKVKLWDEIINWSWYYDIAGCCSIERIRYIIKHDYILPKNGLLNGKTKMDAENYYLQSEDLLDIDRLYSALKEK